MQPPRNMPKLPIANEIREAMRQCHTHFLLAFLFTMGMNLLYLASPLYMMLVYSKVVMSNSMETLLLLTAITLFALLIMGILDMLRSALLVRASTRLDRLLSERIMQALVDRGILSGNVRHSQALRDSDMVRQFLTTQGALSFFEVPWIPLYILVSFTMHPWLGYFNIISIVILAASTIISESMTRPPLMAANSAAVRNYSFSDSMLRNSEVVYAMGMHSGLMRKWWKDRGEVISGQSIASNTAAYIQGWTKMLRFISQTGIMALSAYLVVKHEFGSGMMFVSMIIMGRGMMPIEMAVQAWTPFTHARESFYRLNELLVNMPPKEKSMPLPRPQGKLSVEQVVFAFPGAGKAFIKGISFGLTQGELLGIIGPSAAGKSTLTKMLVGCVRPVSGCVRLDGADISQWDKEDLGRYIGYLPQDIELFEGTVWENICRFTETNSDAVIEAAQKAGLHDIILRLPKGYETDIGQGGSILSGGQKQRLGLARAMFGNPSFIVLDEPNANLDNDGEQALIGALQHLKEEGVTVIVVGHRPSILQGADKMLVLRDGMIELFGPRDEILAKTTRAVIRPVPSTPPPGQPSVAPSQQVVAQ